MKKILEIIVFSLILCTSAFSDTAHSYKKGQGPLKISKNVANVLEYYFSGGKIGKYTKKQKMPWIGELIVISVDGNNFSFFKTLKNDVGRIKPGNYAGRAIKKCEEKSGQVCFLFASRQKIVWDNDSDKKKRKLKSKDVKAGKTLQILQELGFYDGKKLVKSKSESEKVSFGCIKGNCINGQGTEKFANGYTYTGEFNYGQRNGQGTETFADGYTYTGEFKDGIRNGQGTEKFANGYTYTGEFKDGKRVGKN